MSEQINNKIAIVTGGSKGYGFGIAQKLKEQGARVWISGRDEAALVKASEALGVSYLQADVTNPADWDRVFEATGGDVDILINNAGSGGDILPHAEQTDANIERTIAINLTGALFGCRRAAAIMKEKRSGIIVNISSGCAIHAWPGWATYSAAKAGLNQFAHALYTELREFNVRVTTITPYWGATDFVSASNIEGHPAGEAGIREKCQQPEEMGDLIVHVCNTPAHLVIPDITIQPLVQEITPM